MAEQVERLVRLSTVVADLAEAWQFVFAHLDQVGDDPSIEIGPQWLYTATAENPDSPPIRQFKVFVQGSVMVEGSPT